MKKLIIASHNAGKVKEIAELLRGFPYDVTSAATLNLPEPEETGATFAQNAALKARAATQACGEMSLADDSGLAIPALGGAPGIYSARWAGKDKDFTATFARIQQELSAAGSDPHPPAYFICVLCLALPGGSLHTFEGRIDGTLTFPPRGAHGFGYDPIFIPHGHNRTFGECAPEEKHAISHRARAFAALVDFLRKG